MDKKQELDKKDNEENKKTAYNNQWSSTALNNYPDHRERRDGPGGN